MKSLLLLMLVMLSFTAFSQDIELENKDGLLVTYKLVKVKEDSKKDTYLVTVKAQNKNDFDLFYQAPKNDVNSFFATITIRNTDSYVYVVGDKSRLLTDLGRLYVVKKGSYVTAEKEFKIDKGVLPILTANIPEALHPIADFR